MPYLAHAAVLVGKPPFPFAKQFVCPLLPKCARPLVSEWFPRDAFFFFLRPMLWKWISIPPTTRPFLPPSVSVLVPILPWFVHGGPALPNASTVCVERREDAMSAV